MQRGQSTAEYCALVLLVLVVACSLVRFHTPVEALAVDLAHALTAHQPAHRRHLHPVSRHSTRRRPADRHCLCPFEAQARSNSDDS